MTCDVCGGELHLGDWPFCKGDPAAHAPSRFRVDAFEGYWDENLATDPVWITSAHQRRKIMDANGIDFKEDRDRRVPKGRAPLFFDMRRG